MMRNGLDDWKGQPEQSPTANGRKFRHMGLMNIISFGGRRQWVALGILSAAFTWFLAAGLDVWFFVAVSVLFIAYVSRSFSSSFISEHDYSGGRILAYLLPLGMAVVQTLVCLGLVWVIVWTVRRQLGP